MPSNLAPAAELATKRRPRFANESPEYAQAREALLAEEIEVRREVGRLAAQLRDLPPGPAIEEDFRFIDANGEEIGLAGLFGGHDTLVVYHWMYGPDRARPCPMCTATLGPLDANARDIEQRVAWRSPAAPQSNASLPSRRNAAGGTCASSRARATTGR